MDRKPANEVPEVPGIDLQFRPRSYFWPLGLEKHLLRPRLASIRRAVAQEVINLARRWRQTSQIESCAP